MIHVTLAQPLQAVTEAHSILMKGSLGSGPTDLGENKDYTALLVGSRHCWHMRVRYSQLPGSTPSCPASLGGSAGS
ncbi:unnamed protein product [Pleuronectes platessa]|uniref:Uncharacterized protein n=1 Tax=Pleuronectes platessa TaxID=8262 RepID=A0A9N7UTU2_PLEPL|nr:unnamed protein product [Pleuronectes platessa]